jgi:hypothetical protein
MEGMSGTLKGDAYAALLDFEVFQLELQRGRRAKNEKVAATEALTQALLTADKAVILAAEARLKLATRGCDSSSSSSSESSSEEGDSDGDSDVALENLSNAASAVLEPREVMANGRCTGFALVGEECAVVGQTVDLPPSVYGFGDFDIAMQLKWGSGSALCYDVDGRLCPIGFNSCGLGVTIFNLHHTDTRGFEAPGITVQTLAWELLLGPYDLAGAIALLKALPYPMMCGSGLLLADRSGSLMAELAHEGVNIVQAPKGADPLTRSNHPLVADGHCASCYGDGPKAPEPDFRN